MLILDTYFDKTKLKSIVSIVEFTNIECILSVMPIDIIELYHSTI